MKLAGLTAALLLTLFVPLASGSNQQPTLLGDAAHFHLTWQVKPASILYTGDGSGILGGFDGTGVAHPGHLKWLTWTTRRAVGSGAVWIDNCTPTCAHGIFVPDGAKVVASRAVGGHFTRLSLRYIYRGKSRFERFGIRRIGSSWSYYVVRR
jgi:hypothetical protein